MSPGSALVAILMVLLLKVVLQLQVLSAADLGFVRPSLGWSCVLLALTCPLGILIHEVGHLLAGMAVGQCCRRLVIGPVELARQARGWTVRFIAIRHAGLVDLVPSDFGRFRLQRAICAAGGPLASMCAGLVFARLALQSGNASQFWVWSFCVQWAIVGLAGIVPMRRGSTRSDGYLLWEVVRGGAALDRMQRELLTASSHATPLRVRDWPHDLLRRLAGSPAQPHDCRYNWYLAYLHYLDRGEITTAGRYLDRFMSGWTAMDPAEYALEAAYYLAVHAGDLVAARRWLSVETRAPEPWVRLRAQAAVEWASHSQERTRVLVEQAIAALAAVPACGAQRYELDRLRAFSLA